MDRCSMLKDSLAKYFGEQVRITDLNNQCIFTFPLKTLDNRLVAVIVEEKLGGYYAVHDGGKTDSALFCDGLSMTDSIRDNQKRIARAFGVSVADKLIQKTCTSEELNETIMSIAQCAAMFTTQLLSREGTEERISQKVFRALKLWTPDFEHRIQRDVEVQGETDTHGFDFVSFSKFQGNRTAAIKVLPVSHPKWQAERYGYLVLDIKTRPDYQDWARLAVVPRAEEWPDDALGIVKRFSDETIEIRSGHESDMNGLIPESMKRLTSRALIDRPPI
ncbi:MAG: hypothetical protein M3Z23_17745 [Acidobacteriota bacterium]|nr:hypothetical protein [Acidobacteriota bacterium]